jgi:hypothetical protein
MYSQLSGISSILSFGYFTTFPVTVVLRGTFSKKQVWMGHICSGCTIWELFLVRDNVEVCVEGNVTDEGNAFKTVVYALGQSGSMAFWFIDCY